MPNPDEILVRVHAAGLNPVDNKIRDGQMKAILRFQLPATLGSDLAGVVVEVGHRVTRFKAGNAVFASIFGLRTLEAFVLSEERMAVCPISGSYVNQGPNRRYLLRHKLGNSHYSGRNSQCCAGSETRPKSRWALARAAFLSGLDRRIQVLTYGDIVFANRPP
jgi:threonine dehydrogenase-like Zn-dependent dehydrogenase